MKVAFHFRTKSLGSSYGNEIYKRVFGSIVQFRSIKINSIVLVGDFLVPSGLTKDQWPGLLTGLLTGNRNSWLKISLLDLSLRNRESKVPPESTRIKPSIVMPA